MATTYRQSSQQPADVLVIFGISGDLAKVMTFRSLYRLERRGLLTCPVVGGRGRRLDHRGAAPARPQGDRGHRRAPGRAGLRALCRAPVLSLRRLRRPGHLRARRPGDRPDSEPGVLPGDPAVPVRQGHQGPGRRRPDRRRPGGGGEALRPRPRLRPRPQRRGPHLPGGIAAVPDRPLPGQDGPGRDPVPALRQRHAGAALEPQQRGLRADHHGRKLRGRGPWPLLRPGRSPPGRGRQSPHALVAAPPWSSPTGDDAEPSRIRSTASSGPWRMPTPPTMSAASTTATARSMGSRPTPAPRPTPPCGWRSTTGAGPGCRSSSAPASASRSPRPSCGCCSGTHPGSISAP